MDIAPPIAPSLCHAAGPAVVPCWLSSPAAQPNGSALAGLPPRAQTGQRSAVSFIHRRPRAHNHRSATAVVGTSALAAAPTRAAQVQRCTDATTVADPSHCSLRRPSLAFGLRPPSPNSAMPHAGSSGCLLFAAMPAIGALSDVRREWATDGRCGPAASLPLFRQPRRCTSGRTLTQAEPTGGQTSETASALQSVNSHVRIPTALSLPAFTPTAGHRRSSSQRSPPALFSIHPFT